MGRIEAALYASGRPLTAEELARAAGVTSKRKAIALTRTLAVQVTRAFKALEVSELSGQKFVLQLKAEYTSVAKRFASRPLLTDATLKTLSHIVYFQPITANELAKRRGPPAYRQIKELEAVGFISSEPAGRTKVYRTTSAFAEYFGLSQDPSVMKQQLASSRLRQPAMRQLEQRRAPTKA
ncbi:MAG: SMC-Scp complex subunit ScpB [Thaumarchaeota archaeon]|nr:SMC-Scp complex subunit ScpB [Nitrososphaerota archaeon]